MAEASLRPNRGVGYSPADLLYRAYPPLYYSVVEPFFAAVERGDVQIVTSTLTLTEVLVHPYRHGNQALAREYSEILLHARNVNTVPVSAEIAAEASRLRAAHGIRTPDAIQLATAQESHAGAFLTNDEDLDKVTGFNVLILKRLLP